MNSIPFECEIITPIFMAGADGNRPELRPPSIKGAMRFWWRAMNGHLPPNDLRKQEANIFGGSGENEGKSSFNLLITDINERDSEKISLTPHHNEKYCDPEDKRKRCSYKNGKCMKANQKPGKVGHFSIRLSYKNRWVGLENLFIVTSILGGLGKRSRRGFGSFRILKIDDIDFEFDYSPESICDKLNSVIKNGFKVESNHITRNINAHPDANYPYINKIEIGEMYDNCDELLIRIGKSSSKNNCDYTGLPLPRNNNRLASPVYVSVLKDNDNNIRPVVTRLNVCFEPDYRPTLPDKTEKFIDFILKNNKQEN